MEEKRRLPRKKSNVPVSIFDLGADRALGSLVNITVEGILLLGNSLLDVGSVCELSLQLPAAIEGSESVVFSAESVWSDHSPNDPGQYWTGFSITEISEGDVARIQRLMDEYL